MKTILLAISILFCLQISASAQTTATWQGGTPGKSSDWNCHTNWKEGRIPDEFSQVIIPADRHTYPILKDEVQPIDALMLVGGASLTLEQGSFLTILGETGRFNGMTLLGKIYNEGTLVSEALSGGNVEIMEHIAGSGKFIDNSKASIATGL